MEFLRALLKGVIIGIANVIPGVSGGTMMVSMGIYDTLIGSITGLFRHFGKSVKTLLPYALGMLLGIVALASVLTYLFANYPLPMATAFIGLILGGVAPLLKKIDMKKVNGLSMLLFLFFLALIVVMAVLNPQEKSVSVEFSWLQALALLLVGVIASATMIVPGVSGSMVLMLLGYYQTVLKAVTSVKDGLLGGNLPMAVQQLEILVPFGIGVLIGIYAVAKLIEWLIRRFLVSTYSAILGLVVASPVAVLLRCDMTGATPVIVLVSLVTFIAGYVASAALARRAGTNEELGMRN